MCSRDESAVIINVPDNRSVTGTCKFCGKTAVRLVNAHVIPRSFFTLVRGEGKYSVQMKAGRGLVETPYHQAGVADPAIICEECEPKFGQWDTYGFEVFSIPRGEGEAIRSSEGTPLVIPIDDLNYEVLILFLLSVLGGHPFAKLISSRPSIWALMKNRFTSCFGDERHRRPVNTR